MKFSWVEWAIRISHFSSALELIIDKISFIAESIRNIEYTSAWSYTIDPLPFIGATINKHYDSIAYHLPILKDSLVEITIREYLDPHLYGQISHYIYLSLVYLSKWCVVLVFVEAIPIAEHPLDHIIRRHKHTSLGKVHVAINPIAIVVEAWVVSVLSQTMTLVVFPHATV